MKVLFISGHYPPNTSGGGEISTHLIAQGLSQLGHGVTVVTEGDDRDGTSLLDGVNIISRPLGLTNKPLLEGRASRQIADELKAIINGGQYDIIHAHDFRSALALSECGHVPAVVTTRDYAQLSGCTNNITLSGNIDPGCQGWREAITCHRIAEVGAVNKVGRASQYLLNINYRRRAFASLPTQVFISSAQKSYINRYIGAGRQRQAVIYNPISPEYLSEPLREGEPGHVLYVGRVEMYKGVGLLLEAWVEVIKANPHAKLTIAGRGAQKRQYEKYVQEKSLQSSVGFIDHVPYDQMRDLYDSAQIVVAPHLWVEPFGRTVVEGMARGKIVVAADVGGPAEMVEDSKTGFLFKRANSQELGRMLLKTLSLKDDERQIIEQSARSWVRDNLTIKIIAGAYMKLYDSVLSK